MHYDCVHPYGELYHMIIIIYRSDCSTIVVLLVIISDTMPMPVIMPYDSC